MSAPQSVARVALTTALVFGCWVARASAAPPQIEATWAVGVAASTAILHAEVNPEGLKTSYHFDYIANSAYQENLSATPPRDGFVGGLKIPVAAEASLGPASTAQEAVQRVGGLRPDTAYRYRVVAKNSSGPTVGPPRELETQEGAPEFVLPDGRGWEMVSPLEKNGGEIQGFGGNFGGGVLQAAADGNTVTFTSSSSFGSAQGAPGASQYLSRRDADGWSTENITTPLLSGGYSQSGVPYQLFSADLARALVVNGKHCRGAVEGCPVPNPPLPGTEAAAGYLNYYLRNDGTGAFQALLGPSVLTGLNVSPERFDVTFVGATPDLSHVVLSSCAALTSDAVEISTGEGSCNAADPNLYEWSDAGLRLINLLPGEVYGTPGAHLAAQSDAISSSDSLVYWVDEGSGGGLFMREGGQRTVSLDSEGAFQGASVDGSIAFFTKAGHLYRYEVPGEKTSDLTSGGGVQGVLGASGDGSHVYYLTASGLFLWHDGTTTAIAPNADGNSYPPATGAARVSADGSRLVFPSSASLTGYENAGEMEVYLYDASAREGAGALTCVSCNPTGERPEGPASIPGAISNGEGPGVTDVYKPRVLSADGSRVFFDSEDALVPQDTNGKQDVYEWEAQGLFGCQRPGGCISLLSSGRSSEDSSFVDASLSGADVFFLTDASLVSQDPGAVDLYDARSGGGFLQPPTPIPCIGDACQTLPPPPEDPTPGTGFNSGDGNRPVRFQKGSQKKHHRKKGHHSRGQASRHRERNPG